MFWSMRAITIDRFGGPDVLVLSEVPEPPPPGPGEVVLDMVASVRSGAYAITGPDSILPAFLQGGGAAAFLPRGVDCMGLHFEAEIPRGAFAQTDFEDYARARTGE